MFKCTEKYNSNKQHVLANHLKQLFAMAILTRFKKNHKITSKKSSVVYSLSLPFQR